MVKYLQNGGSMIEDQSLYIILSIGLMVFYFFISLILNGFTLISTVRLNQYKETKPDHFLKLTQFHEAFLHTPLTPELKIMIVMVQTILTPTPYYTVGWFLTQGFIYLLLSILSNLIAHKNPESTLVKLVPLISLVYYLTLPLRFLIIFIKKLLSPFFKSEVDHSLNEEELLNIIDEANLVETESNLIKRSIEFQDLIAEDILTPRVEMVALDVSWSIDKIIEVMKENEYSRYPIYQKSMDHIIGVIHAKDLKYLEDRDLNIRKIIKPAIFIPESYPITKLLKQFQSSKNHIAIVIDEHGGTAGLISLEDILEELVGEIWDEHDEVEIELTTMSDDELIVLGSMDLSEFVEQTHFPIDPESIDALTVGGWIIEEMGKIPTPSQTIDIADWKITILEADEKRILKLLFAQNKKEFLEN